MPDIDFIRHTGDDICVSTPSQTLLQSYFCNCCRVGGLEFKEMSEKTNDELLVVCL